MSLFSYIFIKSANLKSPRQKSNGKRINKFGVEIDYPVGEVDFGEPGTNSQHSFFQLIHQGQTIPVDFLGFVQSQHDLLMDNEKLSSHDELMANFFAQPGGCKRLCLMWFLLFSAVQLSSQLIQMHWRMARLLKKSGRRGVQRTSFFTRYSTATGQAAPSYSRSFQLTSRGKSSAFTSTGQQCR